MSDGNFNRALLPHTPYASGMKAGRAMMKARAAEVFAQWLRDHAQQFSEEQLKAEVEAFRQQLETLA